MRTSSSISVTEKRYVAPSISAMLPSLTATYSAPAIAGPAICATTKLYMLVCNSALPCHATRASTRATRPRVAKPIADCGVVKLSCGGCVSLIVTKASPIWMDVLVLAVLVA